MPQLYLDTIVEQENIEGEILSKTEEKITWRETATGEEKSCKPQEFYSKAISSQERGQEDSQEDNQEDTAQQPGSLSIPKPVSPDLSSLRAAVPEVESELRTDNSVSDNAFLSNLVVCYFMMQPE